MPPLGDVSPSSSVVDRYGCGSFYVSQETLPQPGRHPTTAGGATARNRRARFLSDPAHFGARSSDSAPSALEVPTSPVCSSEVGRPCGRLSRAMD